MLRNKRGKRPKKPWPKNLRPSDQTLRLKFESKLFVMPDTPRPTTTVPLDLALLDNTFQTPLRISTRDPGFAFEMLMGKNAVLKKRPD
jgi:hypothetical protein